MTEEVEMIDSKAHVWRVRTCDDETGCVVIEQFISAAREHRSSTSDDEEIEPENSIHVPRDVAQFLIDSLMEAKGKGE